MDIRIVKAMDILIEETLLLEYEKESKGKLTPDVNKDIEKYIQLEKLGLLDVAGAYVDGSLIGFISAYTYNMPHYTAKATSIESYFVLKEHRKFGTGKKLLDKLIEVIKCRGATMLFMSAGVDGRLNKVAKSFGFEATNVIYSKKIV